MSELPRIAVLASGEGQTFEALLQAAASGELRARVVLLVSNRSQCGAAQRAAKHGVPFFHVSAVTHPDDDARDAAMAQALRAVDADWVVLAGYLKKLGSQVLTEWSGRMLNTHPSLLPLFGGEGMYGRKVHEAVVASGAALTGASVHYVTMEYDTGPVIAQVETPVAAGESVEQVEARVKQLEQALLLRVLGDRIPTPPVDLARLHCPAGYVVQPAMLRHLALLPAIEAAAEALFPSGRLGAAMGSTRPLAVLQLAQAQGLLWVALDADDTPVGFAMARWLDAAGHASKLRTLHLQEMDVHPEHGRRGLGSALVRHVAEEARRRGSAGVTLTTFADMPWNAPFYQREGFVTLQPGDLSPPLRAILDDEVAHGLQQRVAMLLAFG